MAVTPLALALFLRKAPTLLLLLLLLLLLPPCPVPPDPTEPVRRLPPALHPR